MVVIAFLQHNDARKNVSRQNMSEFALSSLNSCGITVLRALSLGSEVGTLWPTSF